VFLENSDRYNRADGISRGGQDTDEVTTKGNGGGREREDGRSEETVFTTQLHIFIHFLLLIATYENQRF
jgi:hypothetical protein